MKETSKQILLRLFDEVGVSYPLHYVLEETGIKDYNTLKSYLWRLRKQDLVDVRIKFAHVHRKA